LIPVAIEGVVERIELFEGDDCEQCVSFRCLVFTPVSGIAFPVVEVFHAPMLVNHFADLGGRLVAVFMGCAK
jgi:hypothetical protein